MVNNVTLEDDIYLKKNGICERQVCRKQFQILAIAAVMSILQEKDVLLSLSTGYGKMLIYQLLPVTTEEFLRKSKLCRELHPFILVLSPFISLM